MCGGLKKGACFGKKSTSTKKKPISSQGFDYEQDANYGQQQPGVIFVPNNKQFVRDALDSHNHYRQLHSAGKLKLNDELCRIAQAWSERIARSNTFEHSQNIYAGQSLGENIAMRFTSTGKF